MISPFLKTEWVREGNVSSVVQCGIGYLHKRKINVCVSMSEIVRYSFPRCAL